MGIAITLAQYLVNGTIEYDLCRIRAPEIAGRRCGYAQ